MASAGQGFLQRLPRRIANAGPVRWLRSDRYLLLHAIEAGRVKSVAPDELHVNGLEDLEHFEQTERWLSRDTFIAEARRCIDEGMRLYTGRCGAVGALGAGWCRASSASQHTRIDDAPHCRWCSPATLGVLRHRIAQPCRPRSGFNCVEVLYERIRFGRVQRGRMTGTWSSLMASMYRLIVTVARGVESPPTWDCTQSAAASATILAAKMFCEAGPRFES